MTRGRALAGAALALGGCAPTAGTSTTSSGAAISSDVPVASEAPAVPSATRSAAASEVTSMRPAAFTLLSTAFADGGAIPIRFSCDGEDASPDLTWSGAPDGTVALARVVTDPDARDFVHWLVYDLTGTPSGGLPTAVSASPDAPPQGRNSFGKSGYGGPCPPSGTHRYAFTLYALDGALGLTGTPNLDELRAAMRGHVLAETALSGTYQR
jgi:Raf kinase inhibitor-like YbhB/YbcL family protein